VKRLPFCRCAGNVKVILKEKKLTAKGIYGIFPANQVNDDDIELTQPRRWSCFKAGVSNFKTASPKDKRSAKYRFI
jgi:cobalamin-dependent methionine synthase I